MARRASHTIAAVLSTILCALPATLAFLTPFNIAPGVGVQSGLTRTKFGASFALAAPWSTCGRGRIDRVGPLQLRAQMKPNDQAEKTKKIDLDWEGIQKQFAIFTKMATPYFKEDRTARVLLAIVICFTLLNSFVSVQFSYLGRDFWTALSNKKPEEFQFVLQKFSLALMLGVPISVSYKYYRDKLALQWRTWLSQRVLDMFQADRSYYLLEARKEIDNPDQRIAEDVRAFTKVSLDFSITLLTSVIDLASFSAILLSIYPQLFGAIILYAGFGTFCTVNIGKTLVGLNFEQLQREADFRFSLVRMRENAESIAFYGGESIEMKEIKQRLDRSVSNYWGLIKAQRNLEFFTNAYRYMVQIIPGLVVSPLYFSGKIELGVVSQSYGAFNHILSDLSIIVNQFEGISSFSAGIDRLGEFVEKMEEARIKQVSLQGTGDGQNSTIPSPQPWPEAFKQAIGITDFLQNAPGPLESAAELLRRVGVEVLPLSGPSAVAALSNTSKVPGALAVGGMCEIGEIRSTIRPGAVLEVEKLNLVTPDCSRNLVQGLNLRMDPGQHLLIVGASGTGKSSLLRAVAGLWTAGSGHIIRPPPGETFFLPQKPYCTLGTLREQLLYPKRPGLDVGREDLTDAELLDILRKVRLPDLANRVREGDDDNGLDSKRDWGAMLSLGEQQRLAFGRLLANRPRLAILDEASSALDLDSEKAMYRLLEECEGLTYISVGHRPSLLQYHDTKLKLTEGNGYELEKIMPVDERELAAAGSMM